MGAGRKTKMIPIQEKAERERTVNCSVSAKNLRNRELGSVIFGCTDKTIDECKANNLFGLPYGHFSYVKNVTPGLVLFLFNYAVRQLHGIFEATSPGQLNINPYAWTEGRTQLTKFPAQVKKTQQLNCSLIHFCLFLFSYKVQVRVQHRCRPLSEKEFAPIIAENYYKGNHFWFELDQTQTQTSKLKNLFLSSLSPIPRFSQRSQNPSPEGSGYHHNAVTIIPDSRESTEHRVQSYFSENKANIPQEVDEEWETWEEETVANTKPEGECSYASALGASSASQSITREEIARPQMSKFLPVSSYPSNVGDRNSDPQSEIYELRQKVKEYEAVMSSQDHELVCARMEIQRLRKQLKMVTVGQPSSSSGGISRK
ncbi:OLC1v1001412C2 [Oldenlandia corymbosa var. corymbosa]|uniref:OLC1v1001412C2 n=1 Tax=Oldenlandia corymbosa var. corymbosa TaxID=529605 RepID=A0AAV1D804_OLDCO|nr:OLC1v1001412C2 [Oldenlandia corymbosa var. corymbosa]